METWLPVRGWPRYEVSSLGKIRSTHRRGPGKKIYDPVVLKGGVDKDGYRDIILVADDGTRRHARIAVLVADAFHGPRPDGLTVAHENGVHNDDRAENLTYKTMTDNMADKYRHGTMPMGEGHPQAKLTEQDVRHIRASKLTNTELSHAFGVSRTTIRLVRQRRTWRHVE